MLAKPVVDIARKIKALKIQGARNVSSWAVKAMALQARHSKAKSVPELCKELFLTADYLAGLRPTEPMLQNSLRNAVRATLLEMNKAKSHAQETGHLRQAITDFARNYEVKSNNNLELLALSGAQLIRDGETILTHCHSSSVEAILKRAHAAAKSFKVIATETRPKFQGHITMANLSDAGIDVTAIVDGAVSSFMRDCSKVLVGADAVSSTGDLVNKIGTLTIAHVASAYSVPLYSAAELYKYDTLTQWGAMSVLEERAPEELLEPKKFPNVVVRNPAFDLTPARYVAGYITEKGLFAPQALPSMARQLLK